MSNAEVDENLIENDDNETPQNSGVMIHIVPETSKARWNHVEDLDSFFTRTYNYHQNHGFAVIALEESFHLLEFAFVIWLLTFTANCVRLPILFGDVALPGNRTKVTLGDVIIPMGECVAKFSSITYLFLFLAMLYFLFRLIKTIIRITPYFDIKKFYNSALHIADNELENITWHEIKKKIREVQSEQHMCIDKEQLTELDIYHRILRFKNYMVALMNKNLLPVRFHIPLVGEVVTLSRGLLFNIELILFRGPGSPFLNNWQLREDYTIRSNERELSERLSKLILWVALANFLLSPFIFIWQLIYISFSYANILRKEPSALGMRTWSNYGRLYLRHFNELEHELDARLNRAYKFSDRYLNSFSSPLLAVIAKNILFLSGGLLVLILAFGIYEEFVFQVEHVLTIITILSVIGLVCRNMIPDENLIWCPEQLMTAILAHVHYLPSDWKTRAHTAKVQKEFGYIFQFKAAYLLNEILSPIMTPLILIFVFRPKSREIVKFFRSFTVSVRGVGNVCSFAQMDVRKHGNPEWQVHKNMPTISEFEGNSKEAYPVENGKTELSLVRFTLTNPEWVMPQEAKEFIQHIHGNAVKDLMRTQDEINMPPNSMTNSLLSFGSMDAEYLCIAQSLFNSHMQHAASMSHTEENAESKYDAKFPTTHPPTAHMPYSMVFNEQSTGAQSFSDHMLSSNRFLQQSSMHSYNPLVKKMRVSKIEGRLEGPADSLLNSIHRTSGAPLSHPVDITVADMCLNTLYLYEVHRQNLKSKRSYAAPNDSTPGPSRLSSLGAGAASSRSQIVTAKSIGENTPLLGHLKS